MEKRSFKSLLSELKGKLDYQDYWNLLYSLNEADFPVDQLKPQLQLLSSKIRSIDSVDEINENLTHHIYFTMLTGDNPDLFIDAIYEWDEDELKKIREEMHLTDYNIDENDERLYYCESYLTELEDLDSAEDDDLDQIFDPNNDSYKDKLKKTFECRLYQSFLKEDIKMYWNTRSRPSKLYNKKPKFDTAEIIKKLLD